jgi:predicted metal-binding membrane protein
MSTFVHLRATAPGPVAVLLAALVAAAWTALWAWQHSPLAGHGSGGTGAGSPPELSLPALGAFLPVWTLMVVAMMLPSAFPSFVQFDASMARHGRRQRWGRRLYAVGLILAGYASIWLAFGVAGTVGYRVLSRSAEAVVGSQSAPGVMLQATLLVAGAYQLTRWKRHAMDGACSPAGLGMSRGNGRGQNSELFALGVRYGAECLGRCWALMLLMFAMGTHDLSLMLVLGMVAAVEKNTEWSARLSRPLGGFLIGIALSLVLASAMGVSYVHSHA